MRIDIRAPVLALTLSAVPAFVAAQTSWDSVATVLRTLTVPSDGYQRYNLPRTDLTVRVRDVTAATPLVAGSWLGFAGTSANTMMMGDLVVTAEELAPVLQQLSREGIDVTAIHNHIVGAVPELAYVHVHGEGAATDLAARAARVLARTATPLPVIAAVAPALTVDTARVFAALGRSGRARGAVAQLSWVLVARPVQVHGHTVPPALGYASPVNVQQVAPDRLVATGDFAVLAPRLPLVLTALAERGITATAVHSHLVDESPRVYYVHFWADGRPDAVLPGLRAAVEAGSR